jgi:hypothetical protein
MTVRSVLTKSLAIAILFGAALTATVISHPGHPHPNDPVPVCPMKGPCPTA